jgi:hypothetical protein
MNDQTTVVEQVTEYVVSAAPLDDPEAYTFGITVAWRSGDRWAVIRHGRCLGADGEWDYEPRPSSREDDWLEAHRFDRETALRLARETAPGITVNGRTWAQWQQHRVSS